MEGKEQVLSSENSTSHTQIVEVRQEVSLRHGIMMLLLGYFEQ